MATPVTICVLLQVHFFKEILQLLLEDKKITAIKRTKEALENKGIKLSLRSYKAIVDNIATGGYVFVYCDMIMIETHIPVSEYHEIVLHLE